MLPANQYFYFFYSRAHFYICTQLCYDRIRVCIPEPGRKKIQILDNLLTNSKGWGNYLAAQKFSFSLLEYVSIPTQRFNRTAEYWQWRLNVGDHGTTLFLRID